MVSPKILVEAGPSLPARVLSTTLHMTLRNALRVGSHLPRLPWPYGLVELGARMLPLLSGTEFSTVHLSRCTARLVRATGVSRHSQRVILYIHGGGFLVCGPNTHAGIIARLSKYSDCPVLAVNYRTLPNHTLDDATDDCVEAYSWLRKCYDASQIVIAGDSAGGYLALSTAIELRGKEEVPAALVMMSPLLQLDPDPKKLDANIGRDAMFAAEAFDALAEIIRASTGGLYEPLNWLPYDLPPVLIHVSGHEVLLHDAEMAAYRLTEVDVPVELHIWPGQIHVFQIAAPLLPEADRSLKQMGGYIVGVTKNCSSKDLTDCMVAVQ